MATTELLTSTTWQSLGAGPVLVTLRNGPNVFVHVNAGATPAVDAKGHELTEDDPMFTFGDDGGVVWVKSASDTTPPRIRYTPVLGSIPAILTGGGTLADDGTLVYPEAWGVTFEDADPVTYQETTNPDTSAVYRQTYTYSATYGTLTSITQWELQP
jgi:hypothetical protein